MPHDRLSPGALRSDSRRVADSLLQSGRVGPTLTITVGQVAAEYGVPAATAAAAVRTCLRGGTRDLGEGPP